MIYLIYTYRNILIELTYEISYVYICVSYFIRFTKPANLTNILVFCLIVGLGKNFTVHSKVHRRSNIRRRHDHGILQQSTVPWTAFSSEHGSQRYTQKLQRRRIRDRDSKSSPALPRSGQG